MLPPSVQGGSLEVRHPSNRNPPEARPDLGGSREPLVRDLADRRRAMVGLAGILLSTDGPRYLLRRHARLHEAAVIRAPVRLIYPGPQVDPSRRYPCAYCQHSLCGGIVRGPIFFWRVFCSFFISSELCHLIVVREVSSRLSWPAVYDNDANMGY